MGTITAETIGDLEHVRRPSFLDVAGQLHSMRRKLRLFRLTQKTRYWPEELTPGVQIDVSGGMGLKQPVDEDIVAIQMPGEGLSDARMKLSRSKLRRIENPIGLMLTEQQMAFDYCPHLISHLNSMKTMRRLMRQRLAAKGTIHSED
jgi:hypothetical protein